MQCLVNRSNVPKSPLPPLWVIAILLIKQECKLIVHQESNQFTRYRKNNVPRAKLTKLSNMILIVKQFPLIHHNHKLFDLIDKETSQINYHPNIRQLLSDNDQKRRVRQIWVNTCRELGYL